LIGKELVNELLVNFLCFPPQIFKIKYSIHSEVQEIKVYIISINFLNIILKNSFYKNKKFRTRISVTLYIASYLFYIYNAILYITT